MTAARLIDLDESQLRAIVRSEVERALKLQGEVPEILTREEAAKILSVHPAVVGRYVKNRGLPGMKIGAIWRFKRSEVMAWLERNP